MTKDDTNLLKQRVEFLAYIKESQALLDECLQLVKAESDSKGQKICLGLITKIYKLNRSISNCINSGDDYAMNVLVRPYYETAISLSYLLKNYKEKNFKEFMRTDAMRRRDMLEFFHNSPYFSSEDRVYWDVHTKNTIAEDGFVLEELPKSKTGGSWYRGKTYEHMANNLGQEASTIYRMLYNMGSTAVHPSWSDIKQGHIKLNKSSNKFEPNTEEGMPFFLRYSLLLCLTFGVCENYQRRFGDIEGRRADEVGQLHKTFHKRHTRKDMDRG